MQQMAVFWELLALKFFMKAPLKYNKSPLLGAFPAASLRRSYLPSRQISCASFRSGSRWCASGAPGQTRQRGVMISPLIHDTDLGPVCVLTCPHPLPGLSGWMFPHLAEQDIHTQMNKPTHTHTHTHTHTDMHRHTRTRLLVEMRWRWKSMRLISSCFVLSLWNQHQRRTLEALLPLWWRWVWLSAGWHLNSS